MVWLLADVATLLFYAELGSSLHRVTVTICTVVTRVLKVHVLASNCLNLHPRKTRSQTSILDYTVVQACTSHSLFQQASRQGGLDRPHQDHLGGLDKAYKKPLQMFFGSFLKSLLRSL